MMQQQQTNPPRRGGRPRGVPAKPLNGGMQSHATPGSEALEIAVAAVQRYAETHPRPAHVTQVQAAEMLGLSRATVNRLVKAGALRLNTAGMIPITEVDHLLVAR